MNPVLDHKYGLKFNIVSFIVLSVYNSIPIHTYSYLTVRRIYYQFMVSPFFFQNIYMYS